MYRCPKCQMTFFSLYDLLTHFILNADCREIAIPRPEDPRQFLDVLEPILDSATLAGPF